MNENLRNVTHSHALHALRQTPNRVRLMIHREDDEIYETLEVELHKKKDRGLGMVSRKMSIILIFGHNWVDDLPEFFDFLEIREI